MNYFKGEVFMEKTKGIDLDMHQENIIIKLIKDFFNPREVWGRQNRKQLFIGLISVLCYFLANLLFNERNQAWNPFQNSSNGLLIAVFINAGYILISAVFEIFEFTSSKYPWYEKFMPAIITLLGLTTLSALQNLSISGTVNAALWINISFLLVVFIIAAGYFVEGSSHEKVLKIWFALLGYYFSVIVFFYFIENFIMR